jgi:hypothetical protein
VNTVERIRKRFVEEGLEAALSEHPRPGKERLLDGKQDRARRPPKAQPSLPKQTIVVMY